LLVIIVKIITLTALGFSGLSRMTKAGDKAVATRKIAQLQIGNAGCAADNNGQRVPIHANDDAGPKYVPGMEGPNYLRYFKDESPVHWSDGTINSKLPLNLLDLVAVRAEKKDLRFHHRQVRLHDLLGQRIPYPHGGRALVVFYDGQGGEVLRRYQENRFTRGSLPYLLERVCQIGGWGFIPDSQNPTRCRRSSHGGRIRCHRIAADTLAMRRCTPFDDLDRREMGLLIPRT
jgi:hypothetical protein